MFENAKDKLENAIVVVDKSGSLDFRNQLAKYLRKRIKDQDRLIKKVKLQRSEANNLIQLADYIASIVNRSVTGEKKDGTSLRRLIAHREILVQVWPKL